MKKRKPIAAIPMLILGIVLIVVTIIFALYGKIQKTSDAIFAILIALGALAEGGLDLFLFKNNNKS